MKIFITGISGFVGSHLAEISLKKGHEVSGTYVFPEELVNLKGFKDKIKLYKCDILNELELKKCLVDDDPDFIFHMAAISHVGNSWHNRKLTFEVNFNGTALAPALEDLLRMRTLLEFSPRL